MYQPTVIEEWRVPFKAAQTETKIKYVCDDGQWSFDRIKAARHDKHLNRLRLEWYNKRFSFWGELKYMLFKAEPPRPYTPHSLKNEL